MRTDKTLIALVCSALVGCNANQGEQRAGTAEVQTDAQVTALAEIATEVSAVKGAVGSVQAEVAAVRCDVSDESRRVAETTQKALVAVNKTDQSQNDTWSFRLALVVCAMLAYWVGKVLWIMAGKVKRRKP